MMLSVGFFVGDTPYSRLCGSAGQGSCSCRTLRTSGRSAHARFAHTRGSSRLARCCPVPDGGAARSAAAQDIVASPSAETTVELATTSHPLTPRRRSATHRGGHVEAGGVEELEYRAVQGQHTNGTRGSHRKAPGTPRSRFWIRSRASPRASVGVRHRRVAAHVDRGHAAKSADRVGSTLDAGHRTFSDGQTRDLTQQVTWTSAIPTCRVSNDPGQRGR